ncbi:hypothetical protein [Nonomuraea africana]|uniref:Uncharacterized membrane protein HdeD (DUF308 family) n=1 Tax=Nonomuraea africana TaxID=46171 RepID=A0ABR9KUT0_9ACTN|nr:hypothetical protein [Nonomuraea africana]MBE1565496.1 uncharacterized membrane protein HdeD (DUF308 family) [Nonomuraea africana]
MAREVNTQQQQRLLHRTDWMALLSGILFVVLGILLVTGVIRDALLLSALVVGGLGLAGVTAVVARSIRRL